MEELKQKRSDAGTAVHNVMNEKERLRRNNYLLHAGITELNDCLRELVNIVDDPDGPETDSYTTQPARRVLARRGKNKEFENVNHLPEAWKRCVADMSPEDQASWDKSMREAVGILDMAKGLRSTTPLSTRGAGRDEEETEEAGRTRKEEARLMREHYRKISRLTNRYSPYVLAAIDAWEKAPDLLYEKKSLQLALGKAEAERDRLKKALLPIDQDEKAKLQAQVDRLDKQVHEYMVALQKAREGKMDAQSSRDYKAIQLIELKEEFVAVLEPFTLMCGMDNMGGLSDDIPVLDIVGDVKVTVRDVKRAQKLYKKHALDENGDPV